MDQAHARGGELGRTARIGAGELIGAKIDADCDQPVALIYRPPHLDAPHRLRRVFQRGEIDMSGKVAAARAGERIGIGMRVHAWSVSPAARS